jgi:hypothetical protein
MSIVENLFGKMIFNPDFYNLYQKSPLTVIASNRLTEHQIIELNKKLEYFHTIRNEMDDREFSVNTKAL